MATIASDPYISGDGTIRPRTRRPDDPSSTPQESAPTSPSGSSEPLSPAQIRLLHASAMMDQASASQGSTALPSTAGVNPAILNSVELLERTRQEQILASPHASDEDHAAAASYLADRSAREAASAFQAAQQQAQTATDPMQLARRILQLHTQHGPDLQRTAQELTLEGWDPRLITPKFLATIDQNAEAMRLAGQQSSEQAAAAGAQFDPATTDSQLAATANLRRQLLGMVGRDPSAPPQDRSTAVPIPRPPSGPGVGDLAAGVAMLRDLADVAAPQGERGIASEFGAATLRGAAAASGALATWIDMAAQAIDHPATFATNMAHSALSAVGRLPAGPQDITPLAAQAGADKLAEIKNDPAARAKLATIDASAGNPGASALLSAAADATEAGTQIAELAGRPSPSVAAPGWRYEDGSFRWKKAMAVGTETGTQIGGMIVASTIAGPEAGLAVGAGVGTGIDVGSFMRNVYAQQVDQAGMSPEDARANAAVAGMVYAPISALFNAVPLEAYLAKSPVAGAAKGELTKLAQKYVGQQLATTAGKAIEGGAKQGVTNVALAIAQDFDKWAVANDPAAFNDWKARYTQSGTIGLLAGGATGAVTHLPTSIETPAGVKEIAARVKDLRQVKPEAETAAASPGYTPDLPGVEASPEASAAMQVRRAANHDTRVKAVTDFADANGLEASKIRIAPEGSLTPEQQRVSGIGTALGVDVIFAHPGENAPETARPAASAGPGQIVIDARETAARAATALLSHEIVHEFSARSDRLGQPEAMRSLIDAVRAADPEYFANARAAIRSELRNQDATLAPQNEPHTYSTTHLELPKAEADAVQAAAAKIPTDLLAADGREANPHVTVKYGIHGDDAAVVQQLLEGQGPITVKLGEPSVFKNEDADVVKLGVESSALRDLNARIAAALPTTDTHPEYQPHVTLAYVKPGTGDQAIKAIGAAAPAGREITIDQLVFSDRSGRETVIPLGRRQPTSEEAVAMAAEEAARYVFNPNLSGAALHKIATEYPTTITRLLSAAQGVLRKLGRKGQTDAEILTQRRNTARVALNVRAIAEQLQQTADTLPIAPERGTIATSRGTIRPGTDTRGPEIDTPGLRGETPARRGGPPEAYPVGEGDGSLPLAGKPTPITTGYPVEGQPDLPVEPGLPPGRSTDAAIRQAKQEAVSPGAPERPLGTSQRLSVPDRSGYPVGEDLSPQNPGARAAKGEKIVAPAGMVEPVVKAEVLREARARFPDAKADHLTFANKIPDGETGTRSEAERIVAMSETPPEVTGSAVEVPGARQTQDESRYLAQVNLMEARKQLTTEQTNGLEGIRAYKLRTGDRWSIGASEAEVVAVGPDHVTVSLQHPPEMKIGEWFNAGDRQEFDLPADMIIPANKDSLLRPPEQSIAGPGTAPRSLQSPGDDIPFATRGRAAAITAQVYKAKAREAMAEPEGQQTIGRPDLANPARTEPTRRLVNAADELLPRLDVQKDEQVFKAADARLAADRAGARAEILRKAKAGELLDSTDTVVGQKLVGDAMEQILKSGSDADYLEALRIHDAYRMSGTDAARAFRLRADRVETPGQRANRFLGQLLAEPDAVTKRQLDIAHQREKDATTPAKKAAAQQDVEALLTRQAQTAGKIRDELVALGIDPAGVNEETLANPYAAARIARAITTAKATTWDKASEYWINAILSGPKTHAANIIGNTASVGWETFVQRGIEAAIADGARGLGIDVGNSPTTGEYTAIAAGVQEAMTRAGRNFVMGYNTERAVLEPQVTQAAEGGGEKVDFKHGASIGGTLGRAVRVPTRLLVAEDEFFKGFAGTLDAHAQAYRIATGENLTGEARTTRINQLVSDMGSEAWSEALKTAERLTFQNDNAIAKVGTGLRNLLNAGPRELAARTDRPSLAVPVGDFLFPFIKTATNLALRGAEKTPLVTLQSALRLISGEYKADHSLAVRDAANHLVAYGVSALLWGMVHPGQGQPVITGATPTDRGEKELDYRTAPPMSLRVGSTWYSYARIEPFATALAPMVDAIERAKTDGATAALANVITSVKEGIKDKTFMQGLADIIGLIESPTSHTEAQTAAWVQRFVVSWEPNLIKQALQATDPMLRERRVRETSEGGVWSSALKRAGQGALPIAAIAAPPKVDLWGKEISARNLDHPATDIPYRIFVPIPQRPADQVSELDRLIVKYNAGVPDEQRFFPTLPQATVTRTINGKPTSFKLTDQEYHDMLVIGGQTAAQRLAGLAQYADNPGPGAIALIKKELDQAHHEAADYILRRRASSQLTAKP